MRETLGALLLATILLASAALVFVYARTLYRCARLALTGLIAGLGLMALMMAFNTGQLAPFAAGLFFVSFLASFSVVPMEVEQHRKALAAEATRYGAPQFTVRPLAGTRALRTALFAVVIVVMCALGAVKAADVGAPLAIQVLLLSAAVLTLIVGPIRLLVLWFSSLFERDHLDDDLAIWEATLGPQDAYEWALARDRVMRHYQQFRRLPHSIEGNRSEAEGGSPRGSAA